MTAWNAPMPLLAKPSGPPQLWMPIKDEAVSAAATYDLTWADDLALVVMRIYTFVPVNNNVVFRARTSSDGGASWDVGATDYSYHRLLRFSGVNYASNAGVPDPLLTSTVGNNAGFGVSGKIFIYAPSDARQTCVYSALVYRDTASNAVGAFCRFTRLSAAKVDGLRLEFAAGNIDTGHVTASGLLAHGAGP